MPSCLRDTSPDAWGRRVILNRKFGQLPDALQVDQLDELTYLLESGSDRIGALDFQPSPKIYVVRSTKHASLRELSRASKMVDEGAPLTAELSLALQHGTAVGGARPKALLDDGKKKFIAKFSTAKDSYSVVKAEFVAMRLAKLCGIDVAEVQLKTALGKDVLLIERFDRVLTGQGWHRRLMVSALTLFALDEMLSSYASYDELTEIVRHRFTKSKPTLTELYRRLVFNVLCGNTDDHARNHAAFWDGEWLTLTPAYDICPQSRIGNEASQAMKIVGEDQMSQIRICLKAASRFQLTRVQAITIIQKQIECILKNWTKICKEADLSVTDQNMLRTRQFLNPFAFENLEGADVQAFVRAAKKFRHG